MAHRQTPAAIKVSRKREQATLREAAKQSAFSATLVRTAVDTFDHVLDEAKLAGTNDRQPLDVRLVEAFPFGPDSPFLHTRSALCSRSEYEHLTDVAHYPGMATSAAARTGTPLAGNKPGLRGLRRSDTDDEDDLASTDEHGPKRVRLPEGRDVHDMPAELAERIYAVARERIAGLFYPRVLRRQHRRAMQQQARAVRRIAVRVTPDMLRKNALFSDWPIDVLQPMIDRMILSYSDDRRSVLYYGEPPGSFIAVLTAGGYELLRPRDDNLNALLSAAGTSSVQSRKKCVVPVAHVTAPNVLNEYTFMTFEKRMSTVRVAPRSELWLITRQSFETAVAALPPEARRSLDERARAKRAQDVMRAFPLTPNLLSRHAVFHGCSAAFLEGMCAILRPVCVTNAHVFLAGDPHDLKSGAAPPLSLALLLRGEVGVFRPLVPASRLQKHTGMQRQRLSSSRLDTLASSSNTVRSANPRYQLTRQLQLPMVLNEGPALCRSPNPPGEVIEALGNVDGYGADPDEIERLYVLHPADRSLIAAQTQQRMQKMATAQMAQHRVLLAGIPFVGPKMSKLMLHAFSALFEARVYAPLSVVCCSSQPADRVLILIRGTVCLGHGKQRKRWEAGEAIGYTCVMPHRWAHTAITVDTAEIIEIPRPLYTAFLSDCGIFADAKVAARAIMFPNAPLDTSRKRAIRAYMLQQETLRRTPKMYPVFDDVEVFDSTQQGLVPHDACKPTPVLGGLSSSILATPSRLTPDERLKVEANTIREMHANSSVGVPGAAAARPRIRITPFLHLKPRP